ncbi:MAG: hypothetical protein U9Q90_01095 [Campylobacterota bacterium]|nr:hypothetical protein [Campylobacterota bacterium]
MTYTKLTMMTLSLAATFLLGACAGSGPGKNDFVHQGHNFGADRDANYKTGVEDGCTTAGGNYAKNHEKFNENESYRIGWENGRMHCKGK